MTCDGWQKKTIPVIFFASRASYLDDVDTVRPDNMQAAQSLTEHRIRNGHQRIAWLGGQSSSLTRAERVGAIVQLDENLACRFTAIGCWSAHPARSKPRKLSRRFYVITRPSVLWFAITKLLRWGMVWFAQKQGGKAGKRSQLLLRATSFAGGIYRCDTNHT